MLHAGVNCSCRCKSISCQTLLLTLHVRTVIVLKYIEPKHSCSCLELPFLAETKEREEAVVLDEHYSGYSLVPSRFIWSCCCLGGTDLHKRLVFLDERVWGLGLVSRVGPPSRSPTIMNTPSAISTCPYTPRLDFWTL